MSIALAIIPVVLVSFLSVVWKPTWFEDYGNTKKWVKLGVVATTMSIVVVVATALKLQALDFFPLLVSLVGLGLLTTVMVQSFATDLAMRQVDRHMMNTATLIGGALSMAYAFQNQNWIVVMVSVIILLFCAVLYLFAQKSIGASDIRALAMLALVLMPIMGFSGFIWGSFLAGAAFMGLAIILRIVTGSNINSVPAVPLLLAPYWITTVIAIFMELSLATPQLPALF